MLLEEVLNLVEIQLVEALCEEIQHEETLLIIDVVHVVPSKLLLRYVCLFADNCLFECSVDVDNIYGESTDEVVFEAKAVNYDDLFS